MLNTLLRNRKAKRQRIEQLLLEDLEPRVMLSTVDVFVSGHMGDEAFELQIDGQTVLSDVADQGLQKFTYQSSSPITADQVRIKFTNDNYDPANGIDSNLVVDRIEIDGQTFQTEDASVFSNGTWTQNDGIVDGFGRGDTLNVDGFFQYSGGSQSGGGGSQTGNSTFEVFARGSEGGEHFNVTVNGNVVGSGTVSQQDQVFTFQGDYQKGDMLRIEFTNDQYDPANGIDSNLIVDKVIVNGEVCETEHPSTFSTGTWTAADGIVDGFGRGEMLNVNGYFEYGDQKDDPVGEVGALNGRYFVDVNDNGQDDNQSEPGVEGVNVMLLDANGNPTGQQTVTGPGGYYQFDDLAVGTYGVKFTDNVSGKVLIAPNIGPDNNDSDAIDQGNGVSLISNIQVTENNITYDNDAGVKDAVQAVGALNGRYFVDVNDNGQDDNQSEPGVAGVNVMLLDANGNPTGQQTTTGPGGYYQFDDLAVGTYGVKFTDNVSGKVLIAPNIGPDNNDSDAIDQGNGVSLISNIQVTENNITYDNDAGVKDPAPEVGSLSGRYFMDTNDNNQDDGEPAIAGVQVMLLDSNGNPTGATTFTDGNGNYSFGNLAPGSYSVKFTDPNGVLNGKRLVDSNVGPDATDSDAIGNVNQSVISNIFVSAGNNTPDNDAGAENIPAPQVGSLSGRYFMDTNDDSQDDGEPAIAGVQVMLLDSNGNPTGETTFTDGNGNYSFVGLAAGTYGVKFTDPNNVLDGKRLVDSNVGPDATDSDAIGDVVQSLISSITVNVGNNTPDNDAGAEIIPAPVLGSIGDRVWFDTNGDGLQDDGEEGVADIIVKLKDGNGNLLDATVTNAQGLYLFDQLVAGDYIVEFEDQDGFDFTEQDAFGNFVDDRDSDVDVDTGMTGIVTLAQGQNRRDVDAGLVDEKICIDFSVRFHGSGGTLRGRSSANIWIHADQLPQGALLQSVDFGEFTAAWGNAYIDRAYGHNISLDGGPKERVFGIHTSIVGSDSFGIENAELVATFLVDDELIDVHLCGSGDFIYTPPPTSPVALDLNGDGEIGVTGESTTQDKAPNAEIGRTVEFDIDADGELDTIEWLDGSGDGILVDASKIGADGAIDGSALFGDEGGKYANGFEKLALLDTNGDGSVSGSEASGLAVWVDDGDAILEEGELQSLGDNDVVAISTEMEADDEGRMASTANLANGSTIYTEDVWFAEV